MGFVKYNPNPGGNYVDDCAVRAMSIAMGKSWDQIYLDLCAQGYLLKNMPSSKMVCAEYLISQGYRCTAMVDTCPACYTVEDFAMDNPEGTYILATGSHVVAVVDGDYIDTWDSGGEVPIYYWRQT